MRKQTAILLFVAALPLTGASQPRPSSTGDTAHCRSNPDVVAACFSLHGRMSLWNGSPSLRIWRIGTNRMLGVLPSESPIIPSALRKYLAFGVRVYGNFVVCPFTAQTSGSMQMVCVQSASRVVIQDLRQDNKGSRVMKLSGTYTLAPNNSVKRTQTR